ncbi:hypothetical protein AGLY_008240 [Aphis glycines]|uniref:Uncharacterized protein n=1 Tax=Aphis glycines TaxID=307491 RepID=A0A6G0TLG8_APHGL|nr:hypothetical protein AGLY_008240 [Aphis glycines]
MKSNRVNNKEYEIFLFHFILIYSKTHYSNIIIKTSTDRALIKKSSRWIQTNGIGCCTKNEIDIGSFFMINLCLVVIATQFSETKKREMERMKMERARFHSTSTLTSSTNNSEPSSCYAQMVKTSEMIYLNHQIINSSDNNTELQQTNCTPRNSLSIICTVVDKIKLSCSRLT